MLGSLSYLSLGTSMSLNLNVWLFPPNSPCGPVSPVAPVDPAPPVGPVSPMLPVDPVAPASPVEPVGPASPVGPGVPLRLTSQELYVPLPVTDVTLTTKAPVPLL